MSGRLVFVLHAHLPYVLGHGIWPHGEAWIYEAAAETYLPLLLAVEALAWEGTRPGLTIEISPVLGEQLDDERFKEGFAGHLAEKQQAAAGDADRFRAERDDRLVPLAERWKSHFHRLASEFDGHDRDLVGGYASLADQGQIELFTCARSHGLLPLLGSMERVRRQVEQGVAWFADRFGSPPRGMWMPECAYRPGGRWRQAGAGRSVEAHRGGTEELLEAAGIDWTIVDSHLVAGGDPLGSYPAKEAKPGTARSPYRMYRIGDSSVVALPRDPRTTLQIWSADWGYPGNPWYLEFHKKHSAGGLRYWRVSDGADLGTKQAYEPERVPGLVKEQAEHFAGLVAETVAEAGGKGIAEPVVVAPYDAELFGHWWAEGVDWLLEAVRALGNRGVFLSTASEAVDDVGPAEYLGLPPGSWGDGGDFRIWDNTETNWAWDHVYEAEGLLDEVRRTLPSSPTGKLAEAVEQLERTVLLIEASDWQFLLSTVSAADYAGVRIRAHLDTARSLAELCRRLVAGEEFTAADDAMLGELQKAGPLWMP